MKLTKSLLSPGRAARDGGGHASLSSSLSRRLRSNGSIKGGSQSSPFFTTSGKKRGCAFENPEPSSPKVTCIGQVRVKTKKKVSLSKRRSGGDVSFRKVEGSGVDGCLNTGTAHRNQRWVHLPVSICEALRSFGACKSSCFSSGEREKVDKENECTNENGCGAVFTRWLVSVNDGEGGKRREIELVVGGGDEMAERVSMRSSRRHVFEDIEINEDKIEVKGKGFEEEEEPARVSICIPPKNALLLMRCRSDPMKMAALASRFSWDAHGGSKDGDLGIEEENDGEDLLCEVKDGIFMVKEGEDCEQDAAFLVEPEEEEEIPGEAKNEEFEVEVEESVHGEENQENAEEMVEENAETGALNDDPLVEEEEEEEEVESNMSSFEELLDQENAEHYQDYPIQEKEEEFEANPILHVPSFTEGDEAEENESNQFSQLQEEESTMEKENEEETMESTTAENNPKFEEHIEENHVSEKTHQEDEQAEQQASTLPPPPLESIPENPENQELMICAQAPKKEKETPILPECLLLMMCEPKLSMEVSKETWVCTTDFVRWLPERPTKQAKVAAKGVGCDHEPVKRRLSADSKPKPLKENKNQHLQQPRRSSCSLPPVAPASSMASIIEQKLANAAAYEPFGLTRCKSEPMRTAAAKLIPESCLWKNAVKKLDPQRRVVGAAGVGF